MERAAFELSYPVPRSSQRSIKAIAFASGYKSLSSFSHAFSAYAQMSPREFRNRALRRKPRVDHNPGEVDRIGSYAIVVRDEPAREIAVFDPVTRAGPPLRGAGLRALDGQSGVAGDRYGVELLPNLFVRSRRVQGPAGKAAPLSCVGVEIADWRAASAQRSRVAQPQRPRTTIKLDAGRYAVIEAGDSIASLYRAWCRGFDSWLAATGECPRADRLYVRFRESDAESGRTTIALFVPLEDLPIDSRERVRAGRPAANDGVLSDSSKSQERATAFLRHTASSGPIPAVD